MRDSRRSLLRKAGLSVGIGGFVSGASSTASADHDITNHSPHADRWVESPNYNVSNRGMAEIDWVVLHLTAATDCSTEDTMVNGDVSYHYSISNYPDTCFDAQTVTQYVRQKDIAWHARGGNSSSIGISVEWVEGNDEISAASYDQLAQLVSWVCDDVGVPKSCRTLYSDYPWCDYSGGIVGHRDAPNCSSCACHDTVPTACPHPDGFNWGTFNAHLDNYR